MKKVICSSLTIILFCFVFLFNIKAYASSNCLLVVNVADLYTLKPIANATVYIDEVDKYFTTNVFGNTETISIPFKRNENLSKNLPIQFGETTIFVYKNGYKDKLRFYENVFNNEKRQVRILLATGTGLEIESSLPPSSFINNFILKYKK